MRQIMLPGCVSLEKPHRRLGLSFSPMCHSPHPNRAPMVLGKIVTSSCSLTGVNYSWAGAPSPTSGLGDTMPSLALSVRLNYVQNWKPQMKIICVERW